MLRQIKCLSHMGRLALCKGEGEGEGLVWALSHLWNPTPQLRPLPFCKGRGKTQGPMRIKEHRERF